MKVTLPILTAALAMSMTEARRYHSSGRLVSPRSSLQRDLESSFDLVSEILSSGPMNTLANTILKQDPFNSVPVPSYATSGGGPQYAVSSDAETGVLTLRVELPGVSSADLDVTLENDSLLRIQGKRDLLSGQTMEFDQSFQLDKDVDPSSLQVTLQNGIFEAKASKKTKTVQRLQVKTTTEESNKETVAITSASEEEQEQEGLTITEE